MLIVTRLDRLARSTWDLLNMRQADLQVVVGEYVKRLTPGPPTICQ